MESQNRMKEMAKEILLLFVLFQLFLLPKIYFKFVSLILEFKSFMMSRICCQ